MKGFCDKARLKHVRKVLININAFLNTKVTRKMKIHRKVGIRTGGSQT